MSYLLRPQAEADVVAILDYLAARNPIAAERLTEKLRRRWLLLGEHPRAGRLRDEIQPGLRSVAVSNYISFYEVVGDIVEISRIVHGKRDINSDDFA